MPLKESIKQFFKPTRFKITFTAAYILITLIAYIINSEIVMILYFPGVLYLHSINKLSPSGEDIVKKNIIHIDNTTPFIFSIMLFILFIYTLSCTIDRLIEYRKNPNRPANQKMKTVLYLIIIVTSILAFLAYYIYWNEYYLAAMNKIYIN